MLPLSNLWHYFKRLLLAKSIYNQSHTHTQIYGRGKQTVLELRKLRYASCVMELTL